MNPQPAQATILIVDDETTNIEILAESLGDDYDLLVATSGKDCLDIAAAQTPDLILLDIMMPMMDGFEVCRILKEDPVTRPIPVIFVTAMTSVDQEAKGLEIGAIDYITKPVSPPVVVARVRNHLELKRIRDELENLAATDGLTGIPNRRTFDQHLAKEVARANRSGDPLSVLLLDVDFFKPFNDTYGHGTGDICLRKVAGVLTGAIGRAPDLAARVGGEEFACLLPECDQDGAQEVAERIRLNIQKLGIEHKGSLVSDVVTASIGAVTDNGKELDPADLLARADKALYTAKETGRNRVAHAPAVTNNDA
ncbi:MAG: diguanylate cyclase domain-containing protein [Magnetovibrionaceae bacterium]